MWQVGQKTPGRETEARGPAAGVFWHFRGQAGELGLRQVNAGEEETREKWRPSHSTSAHHHKGLHLHPERDGALGRFGSRDWRDPASILAVSPRDLCGEWTGGAEAGERLGRAAKSGLTGRWLRPGPGGGCEKRSNSEHFGNRVTGLVSRPDCGAEGVGDDFGWRPHLRPRGKERGSWFPAVPEGLSLRAVRWAMPLHSRGLVKWWLVGQVRRSEVLETGLMGTEFGDPSAYYCAPLTHLFSSGSTAAL